MSPARVAAVAIAPMLLFALGAVVAHADPVTTTTTESTESTVGTTTTEASTTTVAVTTTTTTPAKTTTVRGSNRPVHSTRVPLLLAPTRPLSRGCPLATAVVLMPQRLPLVVSPADASLVATSRMEMSGGSCSATRRAQLRGVALFGGEIRAASVSLAVGRVGSADIVDLTVGGRHTDAYDGVRTRVGDWGYLVSSARTRVPLPGGGAAVSALSIHLLRGHAGLPPGTTLLIAFGGLPARAARHHVIHRPLTVTPPLGLPRYVFPVVGRAFYADTYGGFRSDVPGKWHHGDDIFAALGTPVVAVADGTINRIGWEQIGGWRLWVRDDAGDEFYYAHLSGFTPADLRSDRVRAGQVIGFIGNTGDAITTAPHLHFEVHPRSLLHLGYDGAVDPTSYLDHWTRIGHVATPVPAHPPLPDRPVERREARYVFRELLAARHLVHDQLPPPVRPRISPPAAAAIVDVAAPARLRRVSAGPRGAGTSFVSLFALVLGVPALLASSLLVPKVRRWSAPARRAIRTRG